MHHERPGGGGERFISGTNPSINSKLMNFFAPSKAIIQTHIIWHFAIVLATGATFVHLPYPSTTVTIFASSSSSSVPLCWHEGIDSEEFFVLLVMILESTPLVLSKHLEGFLSESQAKTQLIFVEQTP